jgi:hypothetical protein
MYAALLRRSSVLFLIIFVLFATVQHGYGTGRQQVNEFHVPLMQKSITVAAGGYRFSPLIVPADAQRIRIKGRFEATGGSGNDIVLVILDQDGFTNFQNRHRVATYYNSGRVTVGKVDVQLPVQDTMTTYYMVWSNQFSVFSNKVVDGDIELSYER